MRWLILCTCVCVAVISFSHSSAQLATVKALQLETFPGINILPFIAVPVCFWILTVQSKAIQNNPFKNPVTFLIRWVLVAGIWALTWMIPGWYQRGKVVSLTVDPVWLEKVDWAQFQAAVDFKLVRIVDFNGAKICFADAKGRQQQLEAVLKSFGALPPTQS